MLELCRYIQQRGRSLPGEMVVPARRRLPSSESSCATSSMSYVTTASANDENSPLNQEVASSTPSSMAAAINLSVKKDSMYPSESPSPIDMTVQTPHPADITPAMPINQQQMAAAAAAAAAAAQKALPVKKRRTTAKKQVSKVLFPDAPAPAVAPASSFSPGDQVKAGGNGTEKWKSRQPRPCEHCDRVFSNKFNLKQVRERDSALFMSELIAYNLNFLP